MRFDGAGSASRSAQNKDKAVFDSAMRALEAEIASAGMHVTIDSTARLAYARQIAKMSAELSHEVAIGRLTWLQAAQQAQEARNVIMELMRVRSTPVGRAISESIKFDGKSFDYLITKYTVELFGQHADFTSLASFQKNRVFAAIVESAGRSRGRITARMRLLGPAARGLIVISLALSVYTVATANDKLEAAVREVVVNGAGIGGGMAGGAIAGLACGPAAPVCVTVGAFVGGALAAFSVNYFF